MAFSIATRLADASEATFDQLGPWLPYLARVQVALHICFWLLNVVVEESDWAVPRMIAILAILPYALPVDKTRWPRLAARVRALTLPAIILSAPAFMTAGLLLELSTSEPDISVVLRRQYELMICLGIVFVMAADVAIALLLTGMICGATVLGASAWLQPDFSVLKTSWLAITSSYALIFAWVVSIVRRKRAEFADKSAMLSSVGATIAHELRTPLLIIKTRATALTNALQNSQQDTAAPTQIAEQARAITEEVDAANRLIDIFLTNAAQPVAAAPAERFHVVQALQQAIDDYPYRSDREREQVHLECCPQTQIQGPRRLFVHVIYNLLKNAFNHPGEAQLQVQVLAEQHGEHVHISVRDNGRGIDPAAMPHVFEPFYTGADNLGTGVGLAFCKETLAQHFDGTISCDSQSGQWTEFEIRIPAEMH